MTSFYPKPPLVRPDFSHPITQGQTGWWTAPRAGRSCVNLMDATTAALQSGVTLGDSAYGSAYQGDGGANSYIDLGASNRFIASQTTPFTLLWVENVTTGFSAESGVCIFMPSGATNPFAVFRSNDGTVGTTTYGGLTCGPMTTPRKAAWQCSTLGNSVGVWRTYCITGIGGMGSATTTDFNLVVDGSNQVNTLGGGFVLSTTPLNYFGWTGALGSVGKFLGRYDNLRLWKRVLPDFQIRRLMSDPYLGGRPKGLLQTGTGAAPATRISDFFFHN